MKLPRRVVAIALCAAAVTGCVTIDIGNEGGVPAQFRLADRPAAAPATKSIARDLLVTPMPGSLLDDSFALTFSRAAQARAAYQFATWSERPSTQLAQLLVDRLAARRSFNSVALLGRGVGGDLQLNLSVSDFYHDVTAGTAQVRVNAELVDRSSRRLIARQSFAASAPVSQANSAGAASALSSASSQALDALVAWLEATAASAAAAPAVARPAS